MQAVHRSEDTKASAYSPLHIIFMGLRIAKIHEEPIPKELGDVPVIAANPLRTGGLIGTDYVPILFGVELVGESSGVHQVTEHHRELAAFGVRYGRGRWRTTRLWGRDLLRDRGLERLRH